MSEDKSKYEIGVPRRALNYAQAAQYLGLSVGFLKSPAGHIVPRIKVSTRVLFLPEQLDKWLASHIETNGGAA